VCDFKHYYMVSTSEYLVEIMHEKGQMITYDQRDWLILIISTWKLC